MRRSFFFPLLKEEKMEREKTLFTSSAIGTSLSSRSAAGRSHLEVLL